MNLTTKTYLLFLFIGVVYAISCTPQSNKLTYTNVYDLHFTMQHDTTMRYSWLENAAYSNYSNPTYIQDSNRNLFAKIFVKEFPYSKQLRTEYAQRILLPDKNLKETVVGFESKGKNIQRVFITFDAIDEQENIVFSDTLRFIPDTMLSMVTQSINLSNAAMLNIRINVEGEIDKDAFIAFSQLNIQIDGKPIDEFPVRTLSPCIVDDKMNHTSINVNERIALEQIPEINNKKIIGLGESIHGNSSVKNLAYEIILQSMERLNCKLVILEIPMEKSLAFNRFIHDENYVLDTTLFIDDATRNFLNKLRMLNANKTETSKVNLYGMDYNAIHASNQGSAIDIFDFVTELNQILKIPEVDQFSLLLMEEDLSQAINFLDTHQGKIKKLLTTEEIESILHILSVSKKAGKYGIERTEKRDSIMFVNAKFLIDKFANNENVKTIIYGHAAHINPIATYPAVPCIPFGKYMHKTFAENYSRLLILIGGGKSMAYDERYNRKDNPLREPPRNSIEYALNSIGEYVFYTPININFNKLILSRFKGSHNIAQEFYPFNLYQRFNGLFFIKSADCSDMDKKEIPFDNASDMFLKKIRQRQAKIKEIEKRVNI